MSVIAPLPDLPKSMYLDKGGFGEVFRDPRLNGLCIKKFKKPLAGSASDRLLRLIRIADAVRPSERQFLLSRFSWPVEAYGEKAELHGYSMPEAPPATRFSLTVAKKQSERLLQAKFLMDSDYWNSAAVTSIPPAVDQQGRIQLALDLHDAISLLHRHGLVYGDVSGNNICVHRGLTTKAFLLDADSIMTPDERRGERAQTPDWVIPGIDDPVEEDRAKFALFVWRLFRQIAKEIPDVRVGPTIDQLIGATASRPLLECFARGTESAFAELESILRSALRPAAKEATLRAVIQDRYARRLLMWPLSTLDPATAALHGRARTQVDLENRIDQSTGLERRILLRTATVRTEFHLDTLPTAATIPVPRSVDELEQLARDAEFAAIADHFRTGALDSIGRHPIVERSVQHALSWCPQIDATITSDFVKTEVHLQWPSEPWVNAVILDVAIGGHTARDVITRSGHETSAIRHITTQPSSRGHIRFTPASASPSGSIHVAPTDLTVGFTTPTPPAPPRPSPRSQQLPSPALVVVDPGVELARLRLERRRKRRRIALVACMLVALSGGGYWGWRYTHRVELTPVLTVTDRDGARTIQWEPITVDSTAPTTQRYFLQIRFDDAAPWQTHRRVKDPGSGEITSPFPRYEADYRLVWISASDAQANGVNAVQHVVAEALDVALPTSPPPVQSPALSSQRGGVLITWDTPTVAAEDTPLEFVEVELRWRADGVRQVRLIRVPASGSDEFFYPYRRPTMSARVRTVNEAGLVSKWSVTSATFTEQEAP